MTGSVAAVTITGTIYGATLKEDLGAKKVCHYSLLKLHRIFMFFTPLLLGLVVSVATSNCSRDQALPLAFGSDKASSTPALARRWQRFNAFILDGSMLTFTPQEKKRVLEATPEERIEQLEAARQGLVAQKHEMELKISRFHERKKIQEQGRVEPK
jgi:hypothetical protein